MLTVGPITFHPITFPPIVSPKLCVTQTTLIKEFHPIFVSSKTYIADEF